MSSSTKPLFWTFAGLATLAGVALLLWGQPLYAQAVRGRVPDLRGNWILYMPNACAFLNMEDEAVPPVPLCGVPYDTSTPIAITHQTGRIFAGYHPGAPDKLTGFLAPDGTVNVHYFSPADHEREHIFVTATLGTERGTYVLRGYAHGFSELPMPEPYLPYMQTFEVYAVKE